MRTPSSLRLWSLCVLTLALAGCGGGGGGGGGGAGGGAQLPPTYAVVNLNPMGAGSLRDAVNNAPDGAWIVFDPGLATGTITLSTPIVVDRPIVIGGLSGTLERFTISGDNVSRIFEVMAGGSLELRDLVLQAGNAGPDSGGAIHAEDADLTLARVTIVASHAPGGGGGAINHVRGTLNMTDCAVTANTAKWGGGIQVTNVDGTVYRSSVYLNTAQVTRGGGMHVVSSMLRIVDSTVHGNNTVTNNSAGGGISVLSHGVLGPARIWIWFSTVTGNTSDIGGGVYAHANDGEWCNVVSFYSILAENTAPTHPDIGFGGGADGQGPSNVIGVGDGANWFNGIGGNQVGDAFTPLDPKLHAFEFHTLGRVIRRPQAGSPALDLVDAYDATMPNDDPMPFDQRGLPRVVGGFADAGAVERQ